MVIIITGNCFLLVEVQKTIQCKNFLLFRVNNNLLLFWPRLAYVCVPPLQSIETKKKWSWKRSAVELPRCRTLRYVQMSRSASKADNTSSRYWYGVRPHGLHDLLRNQARDEYYERINGITINNLDKNCSDVFFVEKYCLLCV